MPTESAAAGAKPSGPGLLLLQSTSPEAMAGAQQAEEPDSDAWAALVELSSLRGDDESALSTTAAGVVRAVGGTSCVVSFERPGGAIVVVEPRALGPEIAR